MTDELKLIRDRDKANRAKTLLTDELLMGAFETLRNQYSMALLGSPVDRSEDREQLYRAFRVVTEVERHLMQVVENGKLADAEIQALELMSQPQRRWENI